MQSLGRDWLQLFKPKDDRMVNVIALRHYSTTGYSYMVSYLKVYNITVRYHGTRTFNRRAGPLRSKSFTQDRTSNRMLIVIFI